MIRKEFRGEVLGTVIGSGNRLPGIWDYFRDISEYGMNIFVHIKLYIKFARSNKVVAYGVIGNTAGFGPVVLGSSPSRPTIITPDFIEIRGYLLFGVQHRYNKNCSPNSSSNPSRLFVSLFQNVERTANGKR